MEYLKPNFDLEWNEAERYPEFLKMGKDGWIKKASSDFEIDHYNRIKDVLGNVDLDFNKLDKNKKERFLKSYKRGKIEIPLVVKFSENDYDLIGGNTRLSGLIKQGKNPKLWVIDMTKENIEEKNSEILKGGLADNRSIEDIAKKHKIDIDLLKIQLDNGIEVEMEHTKSKKEAEEIAKDHLWEKPDYYIKLKKIETKESTGADSSGSFVGPAFGKMITKREIYKLHNAKLNEEEEVTEITDASSSGSYDVPLFGKTPKGRKNPLKIDGPESIKKSRAVTDPNFPKWGGPKGIFVKVKEKCKKFPYCNQGDINALELLEIKKFVEETSKNYGIPYSEMEKIVINEINKIFI